MFRGNNDTYFIPDMNDPTSHPSFLFIYFVNDALIIWDKPNVMKYLGEATNLVQIISQERF
jgi:hypothetical protein